MNAHIQKLTAGTNNPKTAEILKPTSVEVNLGTFPTGGTPKPTSNAERDEQTPNERLPQDKSKAALDRCMRTAEVMKVLFPEGLHLKDEKDFATFRLFDGLLGSVAQFAQTGMLQEAPLRAISLHAMLLEDVVSSGQKQ